MKLTKLKNFFTLSWSLVVFNFAILPIYAADNSYIENPLGSEDISAYDLYARLIFGFLGFTGVVALVMFIIGGFTLMTAAGNTDKIKKGRDTLIWATLGIIIVFASYAILRLVFQTLKFN